MAVEFEIKYKATPESLNAIKDAVTDEIRSIAMETTYYDTPSGVLASRRYTLRRRMENGVPVCTLKAPTAGMGRGEWETACENIEDAISALCKLGAPEDLPVLVQEGLLSVCGAKFDRIAITQILPDCTVELALDSGILTGGGKQIPLCEVEVELKAGDPDGCIAYARALAARFGLVPEPQSKFRRALALYQGE